MKRVLPLLLWMISTVCVQARLGETIKDLKRRYGQPMEVEATTETGTNRHVYAWDRYVITVLVQQGRSVSEEFTRADRREFTLQEVRDLLVEGSDPGLGWTQVDGSTWQQRDRRAIWTARSLVVEEKARRK